MSRVDHWADVRDRSGLAIKRPIVVPLEPKPSPKFDAEIALLRAQVAQQQAEITALCTSLEAMGEFSDPHSGRKLASAVATKHGITLAELVSDRRSRHLARARQEAMWMLKRHTKLSYPQIGRILGKRDHTTILHGVRRHEARLKGEID